MWNRSELSYCSNLHPGESLSSVVLNIRTWFNAVRETRGLNSMSSGLWLSAQAAEELISEDNLRTFQKTLEQCGLRLTSLNGFPYGNFHADIVKQAVYSPDWSTAERLQYSKNLATILSQCLPDDETLGSISTLPVGYRAAMDNAQIQQALINLFHMEQFLAALHQKTGRKILLCLEMEPDCVLEKTSELISFFEQLQQQFGAQPQYIGACFDICHQGVMYEDICDSLQKITEAGITIGKIQISNAIEVACSAASSLDEIKAVLTPFAQDKFLHQVKSPAPGHAEPHELISSPDLDNALQEISKSEALLNNARQARIHFHIPLHATSFISPLIRPLHQELQATFQFLQNHNIKPHLEIETYTWQVLPDELQPKNDEELVQGIVKEFSWLESTLTERGLLLGMQQ